MIKTILIALEDTIHWNLKNKCKYNNLTIQEVTATLLEEFTKGTFDSLLNIK
jgi:hypothetical protein